MVTTTQRKKIHPHKFALWVAMASIAMMFAGLTSAYIVRKAQGNWRILPVAINVLDIYSGNYIEQRYHIFGCKGIQKA